MDEINIVPFVVYGIWMFITLVLIWLVFRVQNRADQEKGELIARYTFVIKSLKEEIVQLKKQLKDAAARKTKL